MKTTIEQTHETYSIEVDETLILAGLSKNVVLAIEKLCKQAQLEALQDAAEKVDAICWNGRAFILHLAEKYK